MRSNINIKAFIVAIAWMLIFLHEIVPHNHSGNICQTNHDIIHSEACHEPNPVNDNSPLLTQPDSDGKVCHFSTNLFFRFSPDHFISVTSIPDITPMRVSIIGIVAFIEFDCNGPPLITNLSQRGPPIV